MAVGCGSGDDYDEYSSGFIDEGKTGKGRNSERLLQSQGRLDRCLSNTQR